MPMHQALSTLHDRLAAAEEIFFTWLTRVFAAATLVGCAWLDDAPPLELGAMIVTLYVAFRVATEFPNLAVAAPFPNPVLRVMFAVGALALLALAFASVGIFVNRLALLVADSPPG